MKQYNLLQTEQYLTSPDLNGFTLALFGTGIFVMWL